MPRKLLGLVVLAAAICWQGGHAHAQSVTLDQVDGLLGVDTIVSGQEIVFHFRYNTEDTLISGMTNGFRFYSPDGAEWNTASGAWSEFVTPDMFPWQMVLPLSITGTDADTIAFAGFLWEGKLGIPAGFDSVATRVTIGPIDPAFEGKTICVDSAWFPPSNFWRWIEWRGALDPVAPAWDGPHCFTVAAPAPCCEIRGDVDNSGFGPDISDLVHLMGYVIEGDPVPLCFEEADIDGSGGSTPVDIADLVLLIDYMFIGGPAPVACP